MDDCVNWNRITSAMSLGVKILFKGRLPAKLCIRSSFPAHQRVVTASGEIQLTRLSGASEIASEHVIV